ncbi:MAG: helix-turn-helix domain-containing protein [Candidatus Eremiobacteraeota bacterium]|nr:helix-turn-helix domain-containing protein [Candidatus Eremiobacteraeota bacterium]
MTPEEIVAFAEGLARVSAAGGSPKAFANHLAERIDAAVLVEDAEWKHVATAGGGAEIPVSLRDVLDAQHPPVHDVHRLRNGRTGLALPIFVGEEHLGWLAAFGGKAGAFEYAIRLTASAIGVELSREQGGRLGRRRTFWERLLSRTYHDAAALRDDAAARGIRPAPQYVVVCLEFEFSDETHAAAEQTQLRTIAIESLRSTDGDVGFLERSATLFVVVPAPREIDAANVRTAATLLPRTLAKRGVATRVAGGVGEAAPALNAAQSAEQAEAAMIIGRRIYGSGSVIAYDALGAYPLLMQGARPEELRGFAQRALAALRAYDEKHQTELERTLKLYLAVGENVKTAAAELNVHRHTVFYRLRQIAEITGCSLESPHDQLTLRMAIAIDALSE